MILNELHDLPFYCWEYITINTVDRDVDLVIKNEADMMYLVEFLLIVLKSMDGQRDTAKEFLLKANKFIVKP